MSASILGALFVWDMALDEESMRKSAWRPMVLLAVVGFALVLYSYSTVFCSNLSNRTEKTPPIPCSDAESSHAEPYHNKVEVQGNSMTISAIHSEL